MLAATSSIAQQRSPSASVSSHTPGHSGASAWQPASAAAKSSHCSRLLLLPFMMTVSSIPESKASACVGRLGDMQGAPHVWRGRGQGGRWGSSAVLTRLVPSFLFYWHL